MAVDIVGSKQPQFASQAKPNNSGYGQNGFQGPSSDLPGDRTTSGFLPEDAGIKGIIGDAKSDLADNYRAGRGNWQTRTVSAQPITPSNTMHSPNKDADKVPTANSHRAISRPAGRTDFQR